MTEAMKTTDASVVKTCYAGLSVVFFEAARTNGDETSVMTTLTEHQISNEQAKLLAAEFAKYKDKLTKLLIKTSFTQSRLIDVTWRLDYYVKSNTVDKVNSPVYYVSLITEKPDGTREDITFTCNMSEMTELVGKLRDAARAGTEERLNGVAGSN
jgi:COMM domain containing 3